MREGHFPVVRRGPRLVPLTEAGRKRNLLGNTVTVTSLASQSFGRYGVTKKEARACHCGLQDAAFGLRLIGFDEELAGEASAGLVDEDAVRIARGSIKRNRPIVFYSDLQNR